MVEKPDHKALFPFSNLQFESDLVLPPYSDT